MISLVEVVAAHGVPGEGLPPAVRALPQPLAPLVAGGLVFLALLVVVAANLQARHGEVPADAASAHGFTFRNPREAPPPSGG